MEIEESYPVDCYNKVFNCLRSSSRSSSSIIAIAGLSYFFCKPQPRSIYVITAFANINAAAYIVFR